MAKNIENINLIANKLSTSGSGYDILRYVCLPDLLGKDTNSILYVLGKNLARKLEAKDMNVLVDFFDQLGWGQLTLIKEKRTEIIFELTGDAINNRIANNIEDEYRIESGFLAESIQQIKDIDCECIEEIKRRKQLVEFRVVFTR
ncbi:YslB family protein [Aquibacillus koreensis]|uniref:YslB family protein n=1 Tax=Aquibacillus koreensis TaxID=279446 RepID=A0A9X4AGR5_9BACI|nr:YslB family protein [Aquibacillus koreensis]MCT2535078.1 YslB family protein [Aquibacillus koreensis]MDC3419201.1 YslB family protein [Aquibacillus koreensis]